MCDMATGRLELCNRIRMEAEDIERTGFPLEVLPQAVQSVILDMATYENYKIEFIATAMLSAVSAALGAHTVSASKETGRAAERCTSFW